MRTRTARTALSAALIALAALAVSCGGDEPVASAESCKTALREQLSAATATDEEGSAPAECDGLDEKTQERVAREVTKEWLESDEADKIAEEAAKEAEEALADSPEPSLPPSPTATGLTEECRAWIKAELLDATDGVDGTAGYGVCGNLSDEELDKAIEDVSNEVVDSGATVNP
ncbi:hypothetical protein AB0D49_21850 [Streptomyces sp. NPDC048290]|uniref:hypothetical protein n=1 Tax=Streptomyces sp. NPDC048290 TaxID=3155811 RepID=UPI003422A5E9